MLTVFDAPYTMPPLSAGGAPSPFDLGIDLSAPFFYAGGDLLLDVEIAPTSAPLFDLDASNEDSDTVSRAVVTDGAHLDTGGLITRFLTGTPPTVGRLASDEGACQGARTARVDSLGARPRHPH